MAVWYKPWTWFRLRESSWEELYGTPVDYERLLTFRGQPLLPLFGPETRPEKVQTLRTLADHTRARNASRTLAESNPHAAGLIERLQDYAVGRGSTTEVCGVDDVDPPARLARTVKAFNTQFRMANLWEELEAEMLARLIKDGEFFLRLFPDEDNVTKARFVEPAQIQAPQAADSEGEWSYGILTPTGDVMRPEAYCVHDFQTGEDEIVPAQFIVHAKVNCLSTAKRGIPSFHACASDLSGAEKLRWANREGEKARSAIAYFRQWEGAPQGAIQSIQDRNYTQVINRQEPAGTREVVYQRQDPGQVVDVPKGMVAVPPPASPNSQAASTGVSQALEACAARFGVPSWLVSGEASGANFAVALTAESPLTKNLERWQGRLSRWSDDAQTRAVEIGIEQGVLPEDTLERVDLKVVFPSPAARNKLEESQRRQLLTEARVMSRGTWQTEEGLDPAKEDAAIASDPLIPGTTDLPTQSNTPGAEYQRTVNRPE